MEDASADEFLEQGVLRYLRGIRRQEIVEEAQQPGRCRESRRVFGDPEKQDIVRCSGVRVSVGNNNSDISVAGKLCKKSPKKSGKKENERN